MVIELLIAHPIVFIRPYSQAKMLVNSFRVHSGCIRALQGRLYTIVRV